MTEINDRTAAALALAATLNSILELFDTAEVLANNMTDMGNAAWNPAYDYASYADDLHEYLRVGRRQVSSALLLHRYVAEQMKAQPGAEVVAL